MSVLSCTVSAHEKADPADIGRRLCRSVADELSASPVDEAAFKAAIAHAPAAERFIAVTARITDTRTIRYEIRHGTAAEWRSGQEKTERDLAISISDAELNDAAVRLFAVTIADLAR